MKNPQNPLNKIAQHFEMVQYTESVKRQAVRAYVVNGNFRGAEELTGIPWQTIAGWKHRQPVWWAETVNQVTLSLLGELSDSDQVRFRETRSRVLEQLEKRLETGDQKLNVKTGELVRVEIQAKELATIFTALGGAIGEGRMAQKVKTDEELSAEFARIAEDDQKDVTQ